MTVKAEARHSGTVDLSAAAVERRLAAVGALYQLMRSLATITVDGSRDETSANEDAGTRSAPLPDH